MKSVQPSSMIYDAEGHEKNLSLKKEREDYHDADYPLEVLCKKKLLPDVWKYLMGDVDLVRANRAEFDRWKIVPQSYGVCSQKKLKEKKERALIQDFIKPNSISHKEGVSMQSELILNQEMFVRRIMLAPIGTQELYTEEGECLSARLARSWNLPYILSDQASRSLEDVASVLGENSKWFQFYGTASQDLLSRLKDSKYHGIIVSRDSIGSSWRWGDSDLNDKMILSGQGWSNRRNKECFIAEQINWTLEAIAKLKEKTSFPIIVKGIHSFEDVDFLHQAGIDGFIFSERGLNFLKEVRMRIGPSMYLGWSGGIRYGSDILKAVACGADFVLLGRSYIYGIIADGVIGFNKVVENILNELNVALNITGCTSLEEVHADAVEYMN